MPVSSSQITVSSSQMPVSFFAIAFKGYFSDLCNINIQGKILIKNQGRIHCAISEEVNLSKDK